MIEREPDTVRTVVDRIRCGPTLLALTDTIHDMVPDVRLLLRAVTYNRGRFLQADRLLLIGPTSMGGLKALDFGVRGSFTARTTGDSVLVQYARTAIVEDAIGLALKALGVLSIARAVIR